MIGDSVHPQTQRVDLTAPNAETIPCPLCSSGEREIVYAQFSPFAVVRCRGCRFYYLSPRPTADGLLAMYQDNDYFAGSGPGYTNYEEQAAARRATFKRLMRTLTDLGLTGGSLLDVGCGFGYLLEQAQGLFQTRVGIDFSPRAVDQAAQVSDRAYVGGLEAVPGRDRFDCLIANHVIEHLPDPKSFLLKAVDRLSPGGALVVSTPNMGSFWRHLMGHRWPSFKVPEHVLFFDRHSLTAILRAVGLVDVTAIPYPEAFPLSLFAAKLGGRLPVAIGRATLWIPSTTTAAYGRRASA